MTVDEIEQKIKDIVIVKGWDSEKEFQRRKNTIGYFEIEWVVGGQGGGSCYDTDDSNLHAIDSEPEPEFVQLDEVLSVLWPTIGYLQYKVLVQAVVKRSTRQENNYYGNYTNFARKLINIKELAAYLVDHKPV